MCVEGVEGLRRLDAARLKGGVAASPAAGGPCSPPWPAPQRAEFERCRALLEASGRLGCLQAQLMLFAFHDEALLGFPRDPARAVKWLTKAAAQGHASSQKKLAFRLVDAGDLASGRKWLALAAEAGDPYCQFRYAVLFAESNADAIVWLRRSAVQGCAPGMNSLALLLNTEGAVDEAKAWFLKAAVQCNDPDSQYDLAALLTNEGDDRAAFPWFVKASRGGVLQAMIRLSMHYSLGKGCAPNARASHKWAAAALAHPEIGHCDEGLVSTLQASLEENAALAAEGSAEVDAEEDAIAASVSGGGSAEGSVLRSAGAADSMDASKAPHAAFQVFDVLFRDTTTHHLHPPLTAPHKCPLKFYRMTKVPLGTTVTTPDAQTLIGKLVALHRDGFVPTIPQEHEWWMRSVVRSQVESQAEDQSEGQAGGQARGQAGGQAEGQAPSEQLSVPFADTQGQLTCQSCAVYSKTLSSPRLSLSFYA